jgi:hypothetical protein
LILLCTKNYRVFNRLLISILLLSIKKQ